MKFFGKTLKIETRNNFNNFLFPAGLFLKGEKNFYKGMALQCNLSLQSGYK